MNNVHQKISKLTHKYQIILYLNNHIANTIVLNLHKITIFKITLINVYRYYKNA